MQTRALEMMNHKLRRELVRFRLRADRPIYIAQRFQKYLSGKILDVGCDRAMIQEIVGADNYIGVGMTEEASIKLDLENAKRLPFEDGEWETVLCLDTLEHLNNFHTMCDEVFRVAGKHLIISLPNCWVAARRSIGRGSGTIYQYGLASDPPPDRHKWFFNTEEACNFFIAQTRRRGMITNILELVALENRRPLVNRLWRRFKHPSRREYLNLYPHTVVCVYQIIRPKRFE